MLDWRATLPDLPDDGDRTHTWVVIAAEGPLVLPMREDEDEALTIDVTPEWIAERVTDYAALTESGYYEAAHLTEHRRDGIRSGDVFALRSWVDPRDERAKLLAGIRWGAHIEPRSAIDNGALRYASPSWGSFIDERGTEWGPFALCEVSACASPHQKHLAKSHYLSQSAQRGLAESTAHTPQLDTEDTMADKLMETPPEEDAAEPTIADLMEKLELMEGRISMMEAAKEEPEELMEAEDEEEKKELPAEMAELAGVKAQLSEYRDRDSRREFEAVMRPVLGDCPEAVAQAAYQLSEANADAFGMLVGHLKSVPAPKAKSPKLFGWSTQLGSSDSAPTASKGSLSRDEILAKAQAARKAGTPLTSAEYVDLVRSNGHEI